MRNNYAIPAISDEVRKELTDPRSPFSAEDKITVVLHYILAADNSRKAADECGIEGVNDALIRQWKSKAPWWGVAEAQARAILQGEMDHHYTSLMHKAVDQIRDRIDRGNVVLDKQGSEVRVPVPAKDLVYIAGVLQDKRAMIRGEPTSRSEKISAVEIVEKLAAALERQGKEQAKDVRGDEDVSILKEEPRAPDDVRPETPSHIPGSVTALELYGPGRPQGSEDPGRIVSDGEEQARMAQFEAQLSSKPGGGRGPVSH